MRRFTRRPSPTIAEKETELEALLDGFAGLSPKLKERANKRSEALQKEIDTLKRDLADLRIPWENLRADLTARQEALERARAILNREGHFRQKAEALKTVVGRIVCHFGRKGKRCSLKSIDIYAPEVAAVRPLGFLGSPHWNSCQNAKLRKIERTADNRKTRLLSQFSTFAISRLKSLVTLKPHVVERVGLNRRKQRYYRHLTILRSLCFLLFKKPVRTCFEIEKRVPSPLGRGLGRGPIC